MKSTPSNLNGFVSLMPIFGNGEASGAEYGLSLTFLYVLHFLNIDCPATCVGSFQYFCRSRVTAEAIPLCSSFSYVSSVSRRV